MGRLRVFRWMLLLLVVLVGAPLLALPVLADTTPTPTPTTTTTPPSPTVTLEAKYPVLTGESGDSFDFDVTVKYTGSVSGRFNVSAATPPSWTATVTASGGKQAAVIVLDPSTTSSFSDSSLPTTEYLTLHAAPPFVKPPDPGDYPVSVTLDSGILKQTVNLTARVTARYGMTFATQSGKLNTETTAGKGTHVAVQLTNTGTAAIQNVSLTSTAPEGWVTTFNPSKVDSLPAGNTQQIDVVITPPAGQAIAGDYSVTLNAQGDHGNGSIEMRVTVLTPTVWGWIGIVIVLVVIAGLAVMFRVLGRR